MAHACVVEGAVWLGPGVRDDSWMSTLAPVVGRSSPAFLRAHKMFVEIPKREREEEEEEEEED